MHRTLTRLVAVVVFAVLAAISFAPAAAADGDVSSGYCVGAGNSSGTGARVCTPWD